MYPEGSGGDELEDFRAKIISEKITITITRL